MPLQSFRAVLFDLDGVLVDSESVVARTWQHWAERRQLRISLPDLVRRAHGRRSVETIRDVAPTLDADAEARWLESLEVNDAKDLRLLPGADAIFRSVPESRRAVVTSGGRALAQFRLGAVGLPLPNILVGAEDVAHGKPAPDGYALAATRLGVAPADCLVIEDTPPGIAAGRAAGCTVLGVATTFQADALRQADIVVPSLAAVSLSISQELINLVA